MASLKKKVKHLERKVMVDRANLTHQINLFKQRIQPAEPQLFLAQIILGGLTFGFLLGLFGKINFRKKLAGVIEVVSTLRLIPHYINFFSIPLF